MGEAYYEWDLASDRISWNGCVTQIHCLNSVNQIATGKAYYTYISEYDADIRRLRVHDAQESGHPFVIEYCFNSPQGQEIWIEDRFLWINEGGKNGKIVGFMRDITDRKLDEIRLTYLAATDELTGMLNRIRLRERLASVLMFSLQQNVEAAYFVVGIDNLKRINETYGFDNADQVIVAIANRLRSTLRENDIIGRVAGSKFGMILTECTENNMQAAADRLLDVMRGLVLETRNRPVSSSISIGGVVIPRLGRTTQEVMARAEEALDQARMQGRDCFVPYKLSFQMMINRKKSITIAEQITHALKNNMIMLAYQPIVDSNSRIPVMYESLLRMKRPNGQILFADQFIPVAEKLGLIRLLDRRASELAVHAISEHKSVRLTLNVSGLTATDTIWLKAFLDLLAQHKEVAEALTIEITETVAINELEDSIRFVSTLRNLGCKVAVDDFGAGYTSFQNLKYLTFDMVKIDGAYIRGIHKKQG